jgi:hypothetical protein
MHRMQSRHCPSPGSNARIESQRKHCKEEAEAVVDRAGAEIEVLKRTMHKNEGQRRQRFKSGG